MSTLTPAIKRYYEFHAEIIRALWPERHKLAIGSGVTTAQLIRWRLKYLREYQKRIREGEV